MTSYSSVDFSLSRRRMPRSQQESIPIAPADHDGASDDESSYAGSFNPGSLRANFLPPGLDYGETTAEEAVRYGSLRDASPFFSPVFSSLPTVDPTKLRASNPETQALRRKLMRGSSILIIQGGYSGKRFIYERLRELGVHVTIMDGPDTVWRAAAEEGIIEEFIPLDFTDNETVFARAMETIEDDAGRFDGLTSFYEEAIPFVARMAAALGLESNPVDACETARNKRKSRQVMAEVGLPVPKYRSITSRDQMDEACEYVGFPAILKPVYGVMSMGVHRVDSAEEAHKAYENIMGSLNVEDDSIWAQGKELVFEEYYDGEEFDIDILLSEGKCVYSNVLDNWQCMAPFFQEIGMNSPSLYPQSRQKELIKLSVDTTLAFGFRSGAFHVECKYTSRGPRMIEVNARMGGSAVRDSNLTAWGVDLVEEHAMTALRIPIAPVVPEKPLKFMAETCLNAPFSGVVENETWLDHAKKYPEVTRLEYKKKKGESVTGADEDMPDWLAEIIVVSSVSQEHALGIIRTIVEKAGEPPITPKNPENKQPMYFPTEAFPFVAVKE